MLLCLDQRWRAILLIGHLPSDIFCSNPLENARIWIRNPFIIYKQMILSINIVREKEGGCNFFFRLNRIFFREWDGSIFLEGWSFKLGYNKRVLEASTGTQGSLLNIIMLGQILIRFKSLHIFPPLPTFIISVQEVVTHFI